jgi:hypothetical protein
MEFSILKFPMLEFPIPSIPEIPIRAFLLQLSYSASGRILLLLFRSICPFWKKSPLSEGNVPLGGIQAVNKKGNDVEVRIERFKQVFPILKFVGMVCVI